MDGPTSGTSDAWRLSDALGIARRGVSAKADLAGYQVFVRDVVRSCGIGIYDFERLAPQRVRIAVTLDVAPTARAEPVSRGDAIEEVVSYEPVIGAIDRIIAAGHINLVETLAERIIDACFALPRVTAVRAMVEKIDIVPDASVGVVIERRAR